MISVAAARQIVSAQSRLLPAVLLPFDRSVGSVLAEDIISPLSIPSFPQSSMDGYAIRVADKALLLEIQDELPAGTSRELLLQPGKAIKVFTGGPVPEGADVVVQKEWVTVTGNQVRVSAEKGIEPGSHIRMPGSEIGKSVVAIPKGTEIQTMHIGFMASLGLTEIPVIRKPSVAIVITGNELVQPGSPISFGQVYESNSFGLKACLQQLHIADITVSYTKDTLAETESAITQALTIHDLVLITGGVSVGDYDHVAQACDRIGINRQFHGIKQRPGKPLYFGTTEGRWVFGLPGNPASVLSCFYQYVRPLLHALSGRAPAKPVRAALAEPFEKKPALGFFLKGYCENGAVSVSQAQASFQLSAFVQANCWIELEETQHYFAKGTEVTIHPFF
ncbi:MAG: molybdopterin molybdotransferase MoeA [Bacteroidetes bacterium]|nr:molybdopterin molybdotransferase MoeA [Bacteroidota bacterium]